MVDAGGEGEAVGEALAADLFPEDAFHLEEEGKEGLEGGREGKEGRKG